MWNFMINKKKKMAKHSKNPGGKKAVSLMIMIHPYQADLKCKYSRMICRDSVQLPFDIGTQVFEEDPQQRKREVRSIIRKLK